MIIAGIWAAFLSECEQRVVRPGPGRPRRSARHSATRCSPSDRWAARPWRASRRSSAPSTPTAAATWTMTSSTRCVSAGCGFLCVRRRLCYCPLCSHVFLVCHVWFGTSSNSGARTVQAMNRLGLGLTPEQIVKSIEVLDTDGDGEISLVR